MNLPTYEDLEVEFLEEMATHFGFGPKVRFVFLQRFLEIHADKEDWKLAQDLGEKLIAKSDGTSSKNSDIVLRDRLKVVYQKLEAEGCNYGNVSRRRWKIAKQWLREEVFPKWLKRRQGGDGFPNLPTLDELWRKLQQQATLTDKMGPVFYPKPLSKMAMGSAEMASAYERFVPLGSTICFEVQLDFPGYLLLVERDTAEDVWCLSPSGFAPDPLLDTGVVSLPLKTSRHKFFKITGNPGKEQVLALIAKGTPTLDWLPQKNQPLLQLREAHLQQLLEYVTPRKDAQLLYIEYTVTATA